MPINKRRHASCCLWRWLRSKLCFNLSWICCLSGCMLEHERPSCSCPQNCNRCQCGCPCPQCCEAPTCTPCCSCSRVPCSCSRAPCRCLKLPCSCIGACCSCLK
ncbi:unnamed protein product, partial [Musa textilis]